MSDTEPVAEPAPLQVTVNPALLSGKELREEFAEVGIDVSERGLSLDELVLTVEGERKGAQLTAADLDEVQQIVRAHMAAQAGKPAPAPQAPVSERIAAASSLAELKAVLVELFS